MTCRFAAFSLFSLLGVAAASTACNEDLINPMADRQAKVKAYSGSEHYADGIAMRAPPAGTVPRERILNNPALTAGRPPGDEYVTQFPVTVDAALMKLGRKKYDITCGTCHGPFGDGASIVGTQMQLRPPPSLLAYADRAPGYIFEVATNGFGMMASYASELTIRERWAVVAYIKALQLSQAIPADRLTAEERGQLRDAPVPGAEQAVPGAPAHKETH